jgi:uncharacterized membrane protein (DUF485 family)
MLHEPAAESGPDHAAYYKMRLGVWMFFLYGIIYASFVAINVIDAEIMEKKIIFGLNLATTYGFGLIAFALILAVIYNHKCGSEEKRMEANPPAAGSNPAQDGEGE